MIFLLFIFISTTHIIKFSMYSYLCSEFLFCILGLPFASVIRIIAGHSGRAVYGSNSGIAASNPSQDMCVYSVFVLSSVRVAALRWTDPPSRESYRLCKM